MEDVQDVVILGMNVGDFLYRLVFFGIAFVATYMVQHFLARALRHVLDASKVPSASIFVNIVRGVIWAFGLLAVLKPVFGVEPTAFVAALGVSSVVISFGLQDTVSNIFSGLGLMLGGVVRPDDYVRVDTFEGFVTDVNWRNTIVRDRLGNEQIIPNSVLNKTAFTRLSPSQVGSCGVAFSVVMGADLNAVADEVLRAADAALGSMADPEFPSGVYFTAQDAYGTRGTIYVHVKPNVSAATAQDAVIRALEGRPWLASALNNLDAVGTGQVGAE